MKLRELWEPLRYVHSWIRNQFTDQRVSSPSPEGAREGFIDAVRTKLSSFPWGY